MKFFFYLLFCLFPPLVFGGQGADQSEEVAIDFLYINANAGEAAGGHTALRLGDAVFHYQFFPDATFLLVREPWDSFRFLYNDLHNRSIAIASLPLDLSVATHIRNHFTELLVSQQHFFDVFEKLQKENHVIQNLLVGDSEISVSCLGFFSTIIDMVDQQKNLRYHIETELGPEFLQRELARANKELQLAVHGVNRGERPGQSFHEILDLREALRIFVQGQDLDEQALLPPMEKEEKLSADEKVSLEKFANHLTHSIVELLQSTRPDRGETLLLQTARYLAVQHSLVAGQLLSLDPFSEDVRVVQLTDAEIEGGQLRTLQNDLLSQSVTRRSLFFQEEQHPEIAYSLMETSRARAWELSRVTDTQRRVRLLTRVMLPSRPGIVSLKLIQEDRCELQATAEVLVQELEELQKKSEELYGYNLFFRNCATELIRSLNTTFPDKESGQAVLGGWLEMDNGLVFIPFVFYEQSIAAFSLKDQQFLPARRLRNLESLYEQDSDILVWLRESNTLSSSLYEPRSKDTPFLFFTDDALLLRPIQGVLNVGYAALHGIGGIITLPFDGGKRFTQAARGVFYSLPELAFGNIRKGSYSTVDSGREPSL